MRATYFGDKHVKDYEGFVEPLGNGFYWFSNATDSFRVHDSELSFHGNV